VAAVPTGGVVVALPIARGLRLPLVPVHAGTLVAPFAPESPFGAIDEDGRTLLSHGAIVALGLTADLIETARTRAASKISERRAAWPKAPGRDQLGGRTVVLVDDGVRTGQTLQTAIRFVQHHGARACIVAAPCASETGAELVRGLLSRPGERFVCPRVDPALANISDYYDEFPEVTDDEVGRLVSTANLAG
jgi:predicted phosphoribosyltransferase